MLKTIVKSRAALVAIFRAGLALPLLGILLISAQSVTAEPIDFRQAIELALKHSGVILAAEADRSRAIRRYQAERYAYYPTVIFGSGLGYSFGQPIAIAGQAPSIFNITHTQTFYSAAARLSIKAAHSDFVAADIDYQDRTEQVILDTALLYIELDSIQQRLNTAQQQKQATDHALYIAQQRQQEGVGSALDSKRAELDTARVELRITELETSADTLRERLARAMGEPPANLSTLSGSIPAAPRHPRNKTSPWPPWPTPPVFAQPTSASAQPTSAPAPSTKSNIPPSSSPASTRCSPNSTITRTTTKSSRATTIALA